MTNEIIGLCLPSQAFGIANDIISTVITTRRIAVKNKTFVLCDEDTAYGKISFDVEPKQLNLKTFKSMKQHHGITDEKRKETMGNRRVFYAYPFKYTGFDDTKTISCEPTNDASMKHIRCTKTKQHTGRNGVVHDDDSNPITKYKLETDFKLLTQRGKNGTEYHLLIKMPTKTIDFVFDHKPKREFEARKQAAKTIRWLTVGNISARHELNTIGATNEIYMVDSGLAILNLDGDNQKLVAKLDGNKYKLNMTATRKQKTDMWNMEMS